MKSVNVWYVKSHDYITQPTAIISDVQGQECPLERLQVSLVYEYHYQKSHNRSIKSWSTSCENTHTLLMESQKMHKTAVQSLLCCHCSYTHMMPVPGSNVMTITLRLQVLVFFVIFATRREKYKIKYSIWMVFTSLPHLLHEGLSNGQIIICGVFFWLNFSLPLPLPLPRYS